MGNFNAYETIKKEKEEEKKSNKYSGVLEQLRAENAYWKSLELTDRVKSLISNSGGLLEEYNSRFFDKDGNFINQYRKDTASALDKYTSLKNNYDTESASILESLNKYKNYLNADYVKEIEDTLSNNSKGLSDILSAYTSDHDYFSKFKNEEEYKSHIQSQKEYEAWTTADTKALKTEIDALEKDYNSYIGIKRNRDDLYSTIVSGYMRAGYGREKAEKVALSDGRIAKYDKELSQYGDMSKSSKTLSDKKQFYNNAKRVQEGIALRDNAQNALDFDKYSKEGGNISNPTFEDVTSHFWLPSGVKEIKNKVTYSRENYDKALDKAIDVSDSHAPDVTAYGVNPLYLEMNDDEVAIYNYYLSKEGEEKADQFLKSITESLNYRQAEKTFEDVYRNNAFLEAILGASAGLDQWASGVKSLFNTDGEYVSQSVTQMMSGMAREDLGDDYGVIGQGAYDLINTTANMLPSILVSQLTGGIGGAIGLSAKAAGTVAKVAGAATLGSSAAGNGYQEMLNLGYDKNQAQAYGTLVGLSEAGLEYVLGGISSLGGKFSGGVTDAVVTKLVSNVDNAIAKVAIGAGGKLVGSMISEFGEEYLQEVLDPVFKNITLKTDEDIKLFSTEALYSGILGALSAGLLEGGSTISGEVATYKAGKDVKNSGQLSNLKKLGTSFSADTVAYKIASQVNENTDAYTIGQLLHEAGADGLSETNIAEITKSLERKGIAPESAQTIAKWLNKAVEGGYFTKSQIKALENPDISQTFKDVIINQNSTVNQRMQGYTDILQSIANEKASLQANKAKAKAEKKVNATATTEETKTTPFVPYSNEEIAKRKASGETLNLSEGKSITDTENALESKFEVNLDGQTVNVKTGEDVKVAEIASIDNGKMTLKLENGETVDADDISFGTEDEAQIYTAVLDMGVNAAVANSLVKNYNPAEKLSGEIYARGVKEAYKYGSYGIPISEISKKGFAADLSETQRTHAYNLGKADTAAKVEKAQKEVEKIASGKGGFEGKVHFKGDTLALKEVQRESLKRMGILSDVLGVDFHVFESYVVNGKRVYKDTDGKVKSAPNGYYKDGKIYIDLNAGKDGQGIMIYTVAHELTHWIKEWSPAKFKILADFLFEQYGKNNRNVNKLIEDQIEKAKRNGRTIDYDTAYEEVVADSMETMLSDDKVLEKIMLLKSKDESIIKKIGEFFEKIINSFRNLMKQYPPETPEGKLVSEMKDAFEELQSLFAEALVDAGNNYQANKGQKNTTSEGDVKMSLREMAGIEEFDKQTLNNIKMRKGIVVNTMAELEQHIEKALARSGKQNLYFGIISNDTKNKISKDVKAQVFKDKPYSFVISYDDIIHISEHFGTDASVIANEIIRLYDIIENYDTVDLVIEKNTKKLVFDKSYSDYDYRTVEIASNSKSTLDLVTLFITKNNIKRRGQSSSPATKNSGSQRGSTSSKDSIPQTSKKSQEKMSDRDNNIDIDTQINQSMTMDEAKQMIQRAFVLGEIQEWYDGEYKNGDEWLKAQGADEVAMYIENEYTLQEKYINKIQGIIDDEFYVADVLEAYLNGTLTGKEKPKAKRLDVSVNHRINDTRFYSPQRIENVKQLFDVASQKLTTKNRAEVSNARAKILLFAHNKGASELLGLTQTELNKKLRSWSGYTAGAREISEKLNKGVADSNKWTGIENCSWLYKSQVTTEELESLVKSVEGAASDYEKLYIARTMLALDTHIDWSWLSIEFDTKEGVNKKYNGSSRCNGFYRNDGRKIVSSHNSPDTIAHEMGHALDYQWGRDLGFPYSSLTDAYRNTDKITDADTKQFFDNFKIFLDSLTDNGDIRSEYTQDPKEVFARFIARFIQWVDNTGTGHQNYNYEYSFYKDNFTASHYIEFVKLLQEKAMLDSKKVAEGGDVKFSARDSYAPTFYSQMGKTIDEMKQEKIGANSVVSYLKGRGVKNEEIKWSGIETFLEGKKSVTKAELQEFVAGSMLQIEEETFGRDTFKDFYEAMSEAANIHITRQQFAKNLQESDGGYNKISELLEWTHVKEEKKQDVLAKYKIAIENFGKGEVVKYSDYKLDGGENYREITFKMPNSSYSNQAMKAHWGNDAKGILAHARIQDFDVDGKKMLFIEEIQSDWHNMGHKVGYKSDVSLNDVEKLREIESQISAIEDEMDAVEKERDAFLERYWAENLSDLEYNRESKKWQNREHDLRQKQQELYIERNKYKVKVDNAAPDAPFKDNYHEYAIKRLLRMAAEEGYDSIGWTTADIQSKRWSNEYAEGYRIEYDQDIPKFLNKYGKKWGAKVGTTQIETGISSEFDREMVAKGYIDIEPNYTEVWSMPITDTMKNSVLYEGQVMYSDRDSKTADSIEKINQQLAKENVKLIEDVKSLKELLKLQNKETHGKMLKKSTVELVAKRLMAYSNAKGNVSELVEHLTDVYSYIIQGEDVSWETIREKSQAAVDWLMENENQKQVRDEYADSILKDLRTRRISLDDTQKAEVAHIYGNFNNFRKKNMGRVIFTNDGIPLDSAWQELAEMYPMYFDKDVNAADQPILLMDIIDGLQNTYAEDEYHYYSDEMVAQDLMTKVYEGYWDVSALHTVADAKQKEINLLKAKHKERMDDLRQTHAESDAKLRQEHKDRISQLRTQYREREEAKIQKVAQYYQKSRKEAVERVKETREKRDAMTKLQRVVLDTAKWVSYPKKDDVKCPDILRGPYAEFLSSINLSSKRSLDGGEPTLNDLRVSSAMDSLAKAIEKKLGTQSPDTETETVLDTGYLDLPVYFVENLKELSEDLKQRMVTDGHIVNSMTSEEIKELTKFIKTLNHSIKEMSTLYANMRFARVEQLGNDAMLFLKELGEFEKDNKLINFVTWDNALPYYTFKRFGVAGESVFEELMDAQDKLARLADEIFKFKEKTWTDKEASEWSEDVHTIELPSGRKLTLTSADAMSIYCLSRREQGRQHLLGGGVRVLGIEKNGKKAKDSRSLLNLKDIEAIYSSLSERQKAVAEAIQEYMSTVCSEWGNEISMKRFLTKEFTEKFYFPIESNDENLDTKDPKAQQSDLYRLLNISATKPLTKGANNEVIIRNVFDVFTNHSSDMAKLNAYGMALLDYMKWINYREKTVNDDGQISVSGVRKSMETAYGPEAKKYIIGLIKDINGRANDGGDHPFLMKMTRMAKTAMVGANLRVSMLQFTAYPRAAMVLSNKSLALGLTKVPQIEKAKKYCGIALWKSFGFYDTNISRSIEDQIKGTTNIKQKLIELSLKGAEWGDAITWGCLWNACEYEVAKTKQYKVGSEEFNQAVGKKLRDVVYATQVVDSTLTRSQMMRNKSGLTQSVSAFMSEPTLSANILMDAAFQFNLEKRRTGSAKLAWQKTGKNIGKAVAVYSVGQIIAALAESLADAYRDDDDEEFNAKFGEAFKENVISDLNPFNKIPLVADVSEILLSLMGIGFYSSNSLYSTAYDEFKNAFDIWSKVINGEDGKTVYAGIYSTTKFLSYLTGLPASGLMREGVTLWNNTAGAVDPYLKIRTYESSATDKGIAEYNFDKGDTSSVKTTVSKMIDDKVKSGKTEKEAKSAVRSSFTTTYKSEYLAAVKSKDYDEMNRIRKFLYATGLYGTLSELDETLKKWRTAE